MEASRLCAFNLQKSIENVFEDMVNDPSIDIPISFWEFYNSNLMLVFLKATLLYIYAFSNLLTLKKVNNTNSKAESTLEERSVQMAKVYSKVVLHCSNFEHQREDEKFFECLHNFTGSIVKLGLAKEFWEDALVELGFVFRSEAFSTSKKRKETRETIRPKVIKKKAVFPPVYMYASANVDAATAQVKAIKTRVQSNLEQAAKLRSRMEGKRQESIRRRIEEIQASNRREALGIGLRSPRRPLDNQKLSSKNKISVRAMMNTRSPAIARLLPTPKDRAKRLVKIIPSNQKHVNKVQMSGLLTLN